MFIEPAQLQILLPPSGASCYKDAPEGDLIVSRAWLL